MLEKARLVLLALGGLGGALPPVEPGRIQCLRVHCVPEHGQPSNIPVLAGTAGAGGMAPPIRTRISARMKCFQGHISHEHVPPDKRVFVRVRTTPLLVGAPPHARTHGRQNYQALTVTARRHRKERTQKLNDRRVVYFSPTSSQYFLIFCRYFHTSPYLPEAYV